MLVGLSLSACGHKAKTQAGSAKSQEQIITVKSQSYSNTLYFSGYFQPLRKMPVTSPVAGTVIKQGFLPGSMVKKDQQLFKIKAGVGENSATSNLAAFLKAKDSFNTAKNRMQNSDILYKGGLLARNQYNSDISSYYSQNLAYQQAKQALEKSLAAYHGLGDVYELTLQDTAQIQKILDNLNKQQIVNVSSPVDGVALLNSSSDSGADVDNGGDSAGSSASGPVKVGSQVKLNSVLITIGQYKGLAINVNVNEINIEQVKVGQKATITNVALPKMVLTGYVKNISEQASNTDSLPSFAVSIVVPNVPDSIKPKLHFGMSAKVAINITHPAKILIPLDAVVQTAGSTSVNLLDKTTGKAALTPVTTGETNENSVVILSGLKVGDQIIVPH